MLQARRHLIRAARTGAAEAPPGRPGARAGRSPVAAPLAAQAIARATHPLARGDENAQLHAYDHGVKSAFDAIVPVLKQISALQHEADFERQAQAIARRELGFELPVSMLADAWVEQLDMRGLFAWCVFETYRRFSDEVFTTDPLGTGGDSEFQAFLQTCGFHTLDISPCADGRLAHVIRYVLRLPCRAVRRRSYAGGLFDIEDSLDKWVETELFRFREGRPNTADEPTRYLKAVVYHYSSVDPAHEGCAAHGSDTARAARAGLERLLEFQQAIQNTHCCGASIDVLLIGMDTDTDAIRIHTTDTAGSIDLDHYVDARDIYDRTRALSAVEAQRWITGHVQDASPGTSEGMARFMVHLLTNNLSQIDYVRRYHGEHYSDTGHAERFIGAGIGFEEVQLRNLTYFAYLNTVEEGGQDLDVGVGIFKRLNVARGLPVPVVIRYDYHGNVPGARQRATERCRRVAGALNARYPDLSARGLLHTLLVIRDVNAAARIEVLDCSVGAHLTQEVH